MSAPVDGSPLATLLSNLRDARFSEGVRCPRCDAAKIHRWGSFGGRQRYRCCRCTRTFSDLTGTPAAYIKKLTRFARSGHPLLLGMSVRRTAQLLGVHPSTAFRWRHRLLVGLGQVDPGPELEGWVELHELRLVESRKGEKGLDRPARRRSLPRGGPRLFSPRVGVLLACDRQGGVLGRLLSPCPTAPQASDYSDALRGTTDRITAFLGRGSPGSAFARGVVRAGAPYRFLYHDRRREPLIHLRTVTAYARRFLEWLRRFRGVATKYLPNYLVWHRHLDAQERRGLEAVLLRWPLRRMSVLP